MDVLSLDVDVNVQNREGEFEGNPGSLKHHIAQGPRGFLMWPNRTRKQ